MRLTEKAEEYWKTGKGTPPKAECFDEWTDEDPTENGWYYVTESTTPRADVSVWLYKDNKWFSGTILNEVIEKNDGVWRKANGKRVYIYHQPTPHMKDTNRKPSGDNIFFLFEAVLGGIARDYETLCAQAKATRKYDKLESFERRYITGDRSWIRDLGQDPIDYCNKFRRAYGLRLYRKDKE